MRKSILALSAFATMVPAISIATPADAHRRNFRHQHYAGSTHYRTCRPSPGSAGLIAGGVGGAVIGSEVIGGGLVGVAAGAVGGALAGRAIDRGMTAKRRCRNR